jgi:DNA-binding beta-propeller fold protein YncE
MRLTDRFDGSVAPFEGDRTVEIRSLQANAKVSKATVTLTPTVARGGVSFEENIVPGGGTQQSWGATKLRGSGFVEVDFHRRRTLREVQGNALSGKNVQVEMGGIYLQLNPAGAIKSPSDQDELSVPPDGKLPGLTVSKFKLTGDPITFGTVDLSSVKVASVPLNVTARIGDLPPFFAHVGEMSQEQVSPDFATSLQAFLADAPVENGFYVVPLVLHSDSIARVSVSVALDYVIESAVLEPGVGEPLLPFDYSGLPKTSNQLLTIEVPADSRIATRGIQGRVTGTFDDTRILYPPELPLVPVNPSGPTVNLSSDSSLAQPIKVGAPLVVTAIDLFLAVRRRGRLQLDLREDADGKPGSASLLPGPVRFEPPAPVGGEPAAGRNLPAAWLSVPLPAEFKFNKEARYWLVLQSLEGETEWRVERDSDPADPKPEPGIQRTQDGALSWREAVPREAGQSFAGLFRLRGRTAPFRMPIEMRVGPPDPDGKGTPQRVSLNRFAPSGRVDFTLDFEKLSSAANAYLDSVTEASPASGEHLVNGNFEQWLRIGDRLNDPIQVNLGAWFPAALALAPNGSRAYLAVSGSSGAANSTVAAPPPISRLLVVDLACRRLLEEEAVTLGSGSRGTLVLSPDGTRAYIGGSNGLLLVDLTTGTLLGNPYEIPGIFAIAISPDGGALYVTSFAKNQSSLQIIDAAALESFLLAGGDDSKITIEKASPPFSSGAFVAVSPHGEGIYLAGTDSNGLHLFNGPDFRVPGSAIALQEMPRGISVTPDGTRALVPTAAATGTAAGAVAIVNLTQRTAASLTLPAIPVSLAIARDGRTAYVAMTDRTIGIIDLERITMAPKTISIDPAANPVALALTAEDEQIAVANSQEGTKNSLTLIERGMALPNEWNLITGQVNRLCYPGLAHPIALLGATNRAQEDTAPAGVPTAISQVVPVVASSHYELSFRGLASNEDAFAEVIWRRQNCEAFPAEQLPIQAFMNPHSDSASVHENAPPPLASHRKQLIAPEGATQAEIRFIAAAGAVAAVAEASFGGTSERVANADFSLREENDLAAWTLEPNVQAGVTLLTTDAGIRLQNAGARPVELVQNVPAEAAQFFTLEFEGGVMRSSVEATPRVELQWIHDGTPAGEPVRLDISADSLGTIAAHGRSPAVTEAEIRVVVPGGVTLEAARVSLRFTEAIPITLSFMAEAPGELAVTDLRVAFETVPPRPPALPDNGLCNPSPALGESSEEAIGDAKCFCPCCQSEQPLVDIGHMETDAGRPVTVGECRSCGAGIPRFGGTPERGAKPFALRGQPVTRPFVFAARPLRLVASGLSPEPRIAPAETLMKIEGIGPKRAERLMAQSIDTLAKLAETPAEEIVKLLKPAISAKQAERIRIEAAKRQS